MKMHLSSRGLAVLALLLAGCDCPVPLTEAPTRPVDERVLGDWVEAGEDPGRLNLRRFDDFTYIAIIDGDAYRIHHSDFAGRPFVSVQDLNSQEHNYCFYTWRLSADGSQLILQRVSNRVVEGDKPDVATLQRAVKDNLALPSLLDKEVTFKRRPTR